LTVVYDTNLLRVRIVEGEIFGTITDVDGQEYEAYEIQFHTPGEHMYMGY
jgi:carbonic anhydrase